MYSYVLFPIENSGPIRAYQVRVGPRFDELAVNPRRHQCGSAPIGYVPLMAGERGTNGLAGLAGSTPRPEEETERAAGRFGLVRLCCRGLADAVIKRARCVDGAPDTLRVVEEAPVRQVGCMPVIRSQHTRQIGICCLPQSIIFSACPPQWPQTRRAIRRCRCCAARCRMSPRVAISHLTLASLSTLSVGNLRPRLLTRVFTPTLKTTCGPVAVVNNIRRIRDTAVSQPFWTPTARDARLQAIPQAESHSLLISHRCFMTTPPGSLSGAFPPVLRW